MPRGSLSSFRQVSPVVKMEPHAPVRRAWEAFIETGRRSNNIRDIVGASWERSRQFGINVKKTESTLGSEQEIFKSRSRNTSLLHAARPALERSKLFLADATSMVVLADLNGFIIETAGDPRVIDLGRRNHLETGGGWREDTIGTNAIGTALATAQPVQVHGAEHFCEDVQRWTCAATPIHHPLNRQLLGVLNISSPADLFNPQSLAFAMAVGREIEEALWHTVKTEHELLLRHLIAKRSNWLSEDMVLFDARGYVVHPVKEDARSARAHTFENQTRAFGQLIGSTSANTWNENHQNHFPNSNLEIIETDGTALGCIVLLNAGRRRAARSTSIASKNPSEARVTFAEILGDSEAIRRARDRARRLAVTGLPILIEGETGVGKELFAQAINAAGPTPDGPLVAVNCGGMARELIASELFGYVKGAFTGASEGGHAGKIVMADGGVLCLDEIGEMPGELQTYLLRVLEDGMVYPVGGQEGRRVNIRLISMTNRDLRADVEAGLFRRDLFYRIGAATVTVPPLRERGGDVPLLATHFAAIAAARSGRSVPVFTQRLLNRLSLYRWPGNVRELRNVIDVMVALSESDVLDEDILPLETRYGDRPVPKSDAIQNVNPDDAGTPPGTERQIIFAEVDACAGNLSKAAKRLGMARSTLYLRLAAYGYRRRS